MAHHWKALLLLDEADVFVAKRASQDLARDGLVSVFLRKLEYCRGIIFLTTNRVSEFDSAILCRVHLMLKYEDLSKEAKMNIWGRFIERASTPQILGKIKSEELNVLANIKLNGRQVSDLLLSTTSLTNSQP
jgi:hypothetical protein